VGGEDHFDLIGLEIQDLLVHSFASVMLSLFSRVG
jgi:hypothetical protein